MIPEIKPIDLTQPAQPVADVEDFRLAPIDEYFRSTELTPNTQRAYKRSLSRFLSWTKKAWHDIKPQDLDRYKQFLKEQNLCTATICQELAALKSFFGWLTIFDYITKAPTLTLLNPNSNHLALTN
jgi:integrase/recombinase XerD